MRSLAPHPADPAHDAPSWGTRMEYLPRSVPSRSLKTKNLVSGLNVTFIDMI